MKILIIDDEKPIRQWFRYVIDQYKDEFEIVGEAANGREGLKLVHMLKPDLVITDIRMPVMDGLELVSQINQFINPTSILILSNYDDFEFVKKGLIAGAKNYLLKAETDDEDIIQAIRAIKNLNIHNAKEKKKEAVIHEEFHELKSIFVRDWIINDIVNREYLNKQLKYFNISHSHFPIGIVMFEIDHTESHLNNKLLSDMQREQLFQQIIGLSQAQLAESCPHGAIYHIKDNRFLITFNEVSEKMSSLSIENFCKELLNQFQKHMSLSLSFCFGTHIKEALDIRDQFLECSRSLEFKFYFGPGCILRVGQIEHDNDFKEIYQDLHRIYQGFDLLKQDTFTPIDDMIKRLKLIKKIEPSEVRNIFRRIWDHAADQLMQTLPNPLPDGEIKNPFTTTPGEFLEQLQDLLFDGLNRMHEKAYQHVFVYSEAVNEIIHFLELHFDKKISMRMLADHVHLNENYISQLFKKETGVTVQKFLLKIRMERAKNLLMYHHFRIYQIARMVGFLNESHFCTSFKLFYGDSPKNFLITQKNEIKTNKF